MSHAGSHHFYFYDYETFGQHPALDRPVQFAGVRTDDDFNPIESPQLFYCQPPQDYLPDPQAVLITGITPQQALEQGTNEAEFARQIHQVLTQPNSCILGYNSIRFDDEVTRHLFYRNFYDPYGYSWQQGNSRWDLLDVARACYALRPAGIEWPTTEEGIPCFKLQRLTEANDIVHRQAHDALSDVYATIALAKRLRQAQPRLFNYLYHHRTKQPLASLINIQQLTPLVHISGMFSARKGCTSWVVPLAWHPSNQNAVIACDLTGDIEPLLIQNVEWLQQHLFSRQERLEETKVVIPLKLIHLNKCPVLAPANTLRPQDAERLGLNRHHCLLNLKKLQKAGTRIGETVTAIFSKHPEIAWDRDVEACLYDNFFSQSDRKLIQQVPSLSASQLTTLAGRFQDERLAPLLFRYRARNFPHTLSTQEQDNWRAHCQQRWATWPFQHQLQQLLQTYTKQPKALMLLQQIVSYYNLLTEEAALTG